MIDCGTRGYDAGFAGVVGHAVQRGQAGHGVMLCGNAVSACVADNKVCRSRVCHDTCTVAQGVEHDAKVLCPGSRNIDEERARAPVCAFAAAKSFPDPQPSSLAG